MSGVAYNDNNPFTCQWLRNLSCAGYIAEGSVVEGCIENVRSGDVESLEQFHAFAGIGAWSYALRLAGWPDDEPVWTGSCPCQPFSCAGRRRGTDDDRHLWPEWFRLIRKCRPPVIFGEQVASNDGLEWFSSVSADLESEGYAVGAADLCAAGVGAPHKRQRLFFVGYTYGIGAGRISGGVHGKKASSDSQRGKDRAIGNATITSGPACAVGNTAIGGVGTFGRERKQIQQGTRGGSSSLNGFWRNAKWVECKDGKSRAVEPGIYPLAYGTPGRVGQLSAYGNAIVPQVAAQFITAAIAAIRGVS